MITGDYKDPQELLRDRSTTVNKNKQKMERNLKKKKKKKKKKRSQLAGWASRRKLIFPSLAAVWET